MKPFRWIKLRDEIALKEAQTETDVLMLYRCKIRFVQACNRFLCLLLLACFLYILLAPPAESKKSTLNATPTIEETLSEIHTVTEPLTNEVYITPHGIRYHKSARCAGKNAQGVTIEDAKKISRTPCKVCT